MPCIELDGIRLETVIEGRRLCCTAWIVKTGKQGGWFEIDLGPNRDPAELPQMVERVEAIVFNIHRPIRRKGRR